MIKLIGFSALTFGLVEWIYDFKLNGWNFATVLSIVVVIERLHHNHQMRFMLYQIGIKVGVVWELNLPQSGLKFIYPKLISYSQKVLLHQKRRTRKMNLQNINYMTLIPTLLAATKIILQPLGVVIPDEGINEVVNGIASLGTAIDIFLPHTKVAKVAETVVKLAPEINATYQQMFPKVKEVHAGLKKIYEDINKNDGSQAFKDASLAYNELYAIFQSIKPPEPVPEIVEQVSA